jgi:PLP dependent protein
MAVERAGPRMSAPLQLERVRANVAAVRAEIERAAASAGRDPSRVELLAAIKYLPAEELPVLARAGVGLVGENRAKQLSERAPLYGDRFAFDFIGALQSKHVRLVVPHARLIHSLASDSALRELERHRERARPGLAALVEINLSGEASKGGIAPDELDGFIARCPVPVRGLMTMPPAGDDPERSRPQFRALAELARARDLPVLSMGTTQDFAVAVQEGATIVRIGTRLYS